eukprot:m.482266 g.482266  ORF g.482266 m.482266 type:complete len:1283 (-) comp22486_c0_seq1:176-4024(-)
MRRHLVSDREKMPCADSIPCSGFFSSARKQMATRLAVLAVLLAAGVGCIGAHNAITPGRGGVSVSKPLVPPAEYNVWTEITPVTIRPSDRSASSAVWLCGQELFPSNHSCPVPRRLYVLGGFVTGNAPGSLAASNDLWVYEPVVSQWSQVNESAASVDLWPQKRDYHAAAKWVQGTTEFMIVFGGHNEEFLDGTDDTWLFNPVTNVWKQLEGSKPPPRFRHSIVALNDTTLMMFGGCRGYKSHSSSQLAFNSVDRCDPAKLLGDTWLFSNLVWQEWKGSPAPPARDSVLASGHQGVGYVIGGLSNGTVYGDIWQFKPSTGWTQLVPKTNMTEFPIAQGTSVAVTKSSGGTRLYTIHGTQHYSEQSTPTGAITVFDVDTFEWNLIASYNTQAPLYQSTAPPGSIRGSAALSDDGDVVLFGGAVGLTGLSAELWAFPTSQAESVGGDPTSVWTELRIPNVPPPRLGQSAAVLGTDVILVGGQQQYARHQTVQTFRYDLTTNSWSQESWLEFSDPTAQPASRLGHTTSVVGSVLYLFGGVTTLQDGTLVCHNDVWSFARGRTPQWSLVSKGGKSDEFPAARAYHAAFGVGSEYFVVHGGVVGGITFGGLPVFGDIWAFHVPSGKWSPVTLESGHRQPSARWGHAMVFTESLHSALVFGGNGNHNGTLQLDDCWMLRLRPVESETGGVDAAANQLQGNWYKVPALTTERPSARAHHTLAVFGSKVVLFGGKTTEGKGSAQQDVVHNDTWVFEASLGIAGSWTPVQQHVTTADTALLGRFAHSAVAVPESMAVGATMVMLGGTHDQAFVSFPPDAAVVKLGCNPGYRAADFAHDSCVPCAAGTYAPSYVPGEQCALVCPSTWTQHEGSTSLADCNMCKPDSCHGHGTCVVTNIDQGNVRCDCDTGYHLSAECAFPEDLVLGVCVSIGAVVLVILAVWAWRSTVGQKRWRDYSELQENMVASREAEIEGLNRTWLIPETEVTLHSRLDKGAMGEVWKGEFAGHDVAIKLLRSDVFELDPTTSLGFEREIKFLRGLRHKNLLFFYGAGTRRGQRFLVVELCQGSVRKLLNDATEDLEWPQIQSFAQDTARGMAFLHDLIPPIIHRDLKCANLLYTADMRVKLADFGIARLLKATLVDSPDNRDIVCTDAHEEDFVFVEVASNSGSGSRDGSGQQALSPRDFGTHLRQTMTKWVGTLGYLAPEVLRGGTHGTQSDVYSFAVVCWELVTRKLPFYDLSDPEFRVATQTPGRHPPLPQATNCPESFLALINACWQENMWQRPSFDEITSQLE